MPGTKVDPDAEAAPKSKPTVEADPGLAKLYAQWQAREAQNNKLLVQIAEYVRDQKISRAVLKKTLESRGLTASSVSSEVSRIMGLARPDNAPILEKLADDEITVAAARKAISKPQERPQRTAADKIWAKLIEGARIAYAESRTGEGQYDLSYFTGEAANAWNTVVEEYAEKERAAAAEEPEPAEAAMA